MSKLSILDERPKINIVDAPYKGNASIVTLGCAKNQVDSEIMLGALKNSGFEITNDLNQAEVVIVNTCGFLESSIKESIDCVLDVAELRNTGRLRKLIVAGCMVERFKGDLRESLPEVDHFLTPDQLLLAAKAAEGGFVEVLDQAARPYFLYTEEMPRILSTASHYAYVKISEGCNRPCTFCAIPGIRGKMRSRSIDSIFKEVQSLAGYGVREVNLVAQDLTAFGQDNNESLVALLEKLELVDELSWIRLLYTYPLGITQELVSRIKASSKVVPYVDIPLQHSSEKVLRDMKRPIGQYSPRSIVERLEGLKVRTTFIVGFPGETEEDVEDLASFIKESRFSSVGIFTYSKEAGTPSFHLPNHVPQKEKDRRRDYLMKVQKEIVDEVNSSYVGQVLQVMFEGEHEESELLLSGRANFQAPEVDGQIIINELLGEMPKPGQIIPVEITEASGYDLIGRNLGF